METCRRVRRHGAAAPNRLHTPENQHHPSPEAPHMDVYKNLPLAARIAIPALLALIVAFLAWQARNHGHKHHRQERLGCEAFLGADDFPQSLRNSFVTNRGN